MRGGGDLGSCGADGNGGSGGGGGGGGGVGGGAAALAALPACVPVLLILPFGLILEPEYVQLCIRKYFTDIYRSWKTVT